MGSTGERGRLTDAVAGGVAVLVAAGALLGIVAIRGRAGLFNDFYDYWGAGRLLLGGHNPYDVGALQETLRGAGVGNLVGRGFSYPLIAGLVVSPLALLPPGVAAAVFAGVSLAALGAAVWLLAAEVRGVGGAVVLGLASALFVPVAGSLYFGQANLVVLLLLALAYRGRRPATAIVAAGVIKLFPVVGLAALLAPGLRDVRRLLAALGATVVAVAVPAVLFRPAGREGVDALLAPDGFWSNQSVNGWLTRLSVTTSITRPPLPGLPVVAVEGVLLGAAAVAVMVVVLRAPNGAWSGCLALALGSGALAAPKDSIWNLAPLLLGLVWAWPRVGGWLRAVLAVGFVLFEVQGALNLARDSVYLSTPLLTWASSLALYGGVMVLVVVGLCLRRERVVAAAR